MYDVGDYNDLISVRRFGREPYPNISRSDVAGRSKETDTGEAGLKKVLGLFQPGQYEKPRVVAIQGLACVQTNRSLGSSKTYKLDVDHLCDSVGHTGRCNGGHSLQNITSRADQGLGKSEVSAMYMYLVYSPLR